MIPLQSTEMTSQTYAFIRQKPEFGSKAIISANAWYFANQNGNWRARLLRIQVLTPLAEAFTDHACAIWLRFLRSGH
jgi:hypothetical protein